MIRSRIPGKDNGAILRLIRRELLPLTRRNFPDVTFDRTDTLRRLRQGRTFVAVKGDQPPLGFIHTVVSGDQLFIDMLAVGSLKQGRGFGSALMDYAEEYGRKRGCRTALLYVDDHNGKAQGFYESRGYRREGYVSQLRCYEYRKTLAGNSGEQAAGAEDGPFPFTAMPGLPGAAAFPGIGFWN